MLSVIINRTLCNFAQPFLFNDLITHMDILKLSSECKKVVSSEHY